MSDFRRLTVWQKAHSLALGVERASSQIRSSHHIAIRSQLVRSAFSIPANIVEGRTRQSQAEFVRFLRIALNSASELEYHLLAARDIGALHPDRYAELNEKTVEVAKMLQGLITRVGADAGNDARR